MPKKNPYFIPKENIPKTEEIRYLEQEIPSFEEFMKTYEADEGVIDSYNGEVDGYKDIGVGKRFGPMPFSDNSSALIVARSQEIIRELRRNYPTVVQLLDHNRAGTVAFLKANGAVFTYDLVHEFYVPSGSNSSWGPEVWRKYKEEINNYVDKMCKNLVDQEGRIIDREVLRPAREELANYIHKEYKRELPRWPFWFSENTASIKLGISGSYRTNTNYYVVWSCSGWIDVRDENRGFADYHARFSGRPEVKVVILDFDKLGDIERDFRGNIKAAEDFIDRKEIEYRNQGGNLLGYWDTKYI